MSGHETLNVLPRDPTINNHHSFTGYVCQWSRRWFMHWADGRIAYRPHGNPENRMLSRDKGYFEVGRCRCATAPSTPTAVQAGECHWGWGDWWI